MDNPEKLATWSTQDEEKRNKNRTQYGHHYAQAIQNNNNKTIQYGRLTIKQRVPL